MDNFANFSEDLFRKFSRHLPDLIFQFTRRPDKSYCVPIASIGIKNIFGCLPEDVKENLDPILKVIHPEDHNLLIEKIEYSANNLTEFICEFRVCIPNKSVQWILAKSTPENLTDESITWYGLCTNITQQKKALKKITILANKLEAILKAIPDLIFEIGLSGKIYNYYSKKIDTLLILPENFIGLNTFDIMPNSVNEVLKVSLNEAIENGHSIGRQYELVLPNNKLWFELSVSPIELPINDEQRFIVLSRDITERKRDLDKLIQLSQAVEQSTSSIIISDLDGNLEFVNHFFTQITGYTVDEAVGTSTRILQSGLTPKLTYKEMWNTIKSGKTWNGEFLNKKKDGSLFWEDVTISPVRDNSGEIKHFLAIKNDITKDKEIEARFNKIAVDQSHQVRGPLTNILGITKLLNFDITNEEKSYLTSQLEIAAKELDKAIHRVVGESRNQQIN